MVNAADVGINLNFCTVFGDVLFPLEFLQQAFLFQILLLLFEQPSLCFFVWVYENFSRKAVYNGFHAVLNRLQECIAHADDCRNIHVSCKNRRVRVGRTVCGDKRQHFIFIQRNGFTRGEVVCTNNHAFLGCGCTGDVSGQVCNDAVRNVFHICCSCLHICILHGRKHLCKVVRRHSNGIFCIDFLGFNDVGNAFVVILIFQHHHVNLENLSVGFADFFQCLFIDCLQLFTGSRLCSFDSCLFRLGIFYMHPLNRGIILLKNGEFSNGNRSINTFS